MKSEHPGVFSGLSSTMDKVKDLIESGKSSLSDFSFGTLNVSQQADLQLLAELQLISEVIQAVSKKTNYSTGLREPGLE